MVSFKKLLDESPEERDERRRRYEAEEEARTKAEKRKIERLCAIDEGLTDWEVGFVQSVARQFENGYLTDKQWAIVDRLLEESE